MKLSILLISCFIMLFPISCGDNTSNGHLRDATDADASDMDSIDTEVPTCTDRDDDGYFEDQDGCEPIDCDDDDPEVNPSMSEICDGLDNDCDGRIDDLPTCSSCQPDDRQSCYSGPEGTVGVGDCTSGEQVCSEEGRWSICTGQVLPSEELCNGSDDDCDGFVDEEPLHLGEVCQSGLLGECATGRYACTNDRLTCIPTTEASTELCDGIDNDCDGVVDDGEPEAGLDCDTGLDGPCSTGMTTCTDGELSCRSVHISEEVCDGVDNDCNGVVDDVGEGCNTGMAGNCALGLWRCVENEVTCIPSNVSAEVCDGVDNDCNNVVDDFGDPCETGLLGNCALGFWDCVGNEVTCIPANVAEEVCDGEDNDCDGIMDNVIVDDGNECETGLLGNCALGLLGCIGDEVTCIPANVAEEVCDGEDNDCDGFLDENQCSDQNVQICNEQGTWETVHCVSGCGDFGGGIQFCLMEQEIEPNNIPTQANQFGLPGYPFEVYGQISSDSDVDWYKFQLTTTREIHIETSPFTMFGEDVEDTTIYLTNSIDCTNGGSCQGDTTFACQDEHIVPYCSRVHYDISGAYRYSAMNRELQPGTYFVVVTGGYPENTGYYRLVVDDR